MHLPQVLYPSWYQRLLSRLWQHLTSERAGLSYFESGTMQPSYWSNSRFWSTWRKSSWQVRCVYIHSSFSVSGVVLEHVNSTNTHGWHAIAVISPRRYKHSLLSCTETTALGPCSGLWMEVRVTAHKRLYLHTNYSLWSLRKWCQHKLVKSLVVMWYVAAWWITICSIIACTVSHGEKIRWIILIIFVVSSWVNNKNGL